MATDSTPQDDAIATTEVAFGQVVTVRPVPTRGVTQIVIEIPTEFHVKCTAMLFGKDAYVFAAKPSAGKPYGVCRLDQVDDTIADPVTSQGPTSASAQKMATWRRGGLTQRVNVSQWLGIQCQSRAFMSWLGVENSLAAIESVRAKCEVASRRDIANDPGALDRFMTMIYLPFENYSQGQTRS